MKKMALMVAAAVAMAAAPAAMAGDAGLTAKVPFEFVVADQHLPSGEYQLVQDEQNRRLWIYSADELVAVTHWVPVGGESSGAAGLVFRKLGDTRVLTALRAGQSRAYVPAPRASR